jgi:hypothetical protein
MISIPAFLWMLTWAKREEIKMLYILVGSPSISNAPEYTMARNSDGQGNTAYCRQTGPSRVSRS